VKKGATRISTVLPPAEARRFRQVKRYVEGFCGRSTNADVMGFLVRSWDWDVEYERGLSIWTPHVKTKAPPRVLLTYYLVKNILDRLPEVDLGVGKDGKKIILSCHMLCRALADVVKGVTVADGQFAGPFCHSWLVARGRGRSDRWIIDAYPAGIMAGPLLVDAGVGHLSPGHLLYREGDVEAVLLDFSSRLFVRSVARVIKAIRRVA